LIQAVTKKGETALYLAAAADAATVGVLLDHHANMDALAATGEPWDMPIVNAATNGMADVLTLMVKRGAKLTDSFNNYRVVDFCSTVEAARALGGG
jgi:hypothetical protein